MLVKKYLETIPVSNVSFKKGGKGYNQNQYISAEIVDDKKYGRIYVANIYDDDKRLCRRFFSDGLSGITLNLANGWEKRQLDPSGYKYAFKDIGNSLEVTREFFKKKHYQNSGSIIDCFMSDKRREVRERAEESKRNKMLRHFDLYPGDPKDLNKYCDEYVFQNRYIVFFKKEKKLEKQKCRCLYCGKTFTVKDKLEHRQMLSCPKCKSESIAIAERYVTSLKDKAKMCFINNVEGNLITLWQKITRTYAENFKPTYKKEAYFYDVLTDQNKRYYYKYLSSYYNVGFTRTKYSNIGDRAYIYSNNLIRDVYKGILPYGLNMDRLRYAREVDLINLMSSAATSGISSKLFKIGLYELAGNAEGLKHGETFVEVLGVTKSYLPSFKKFNITNQELKIIKKSDCFLSEDMIGKIVNLCRRNATYNLLAAVDSILSHMTFVKAVNYFYKQGQIHKRTDWGTMVGWYLDYINMAKQYNKGRKKELQIDITTSIFKYPRDIKIAHDGMTQKVRIVRKAARERKIKKLAKQYKERNAFARNELTVIYPEDLADFIKEGSALNHCVGNGDGYYNSHVDGTELTIFIRKIKELKKPYYTATFYTADFKLRECHGISHKAPPESVRKFLKDYGEFMIESRDQIVTSKGA